MFSSSFFFVKQTNVFQWSIVFFIAAGFYGVGNLLFCLFGQTKVQPWNDPLPQPAEMQLMQPYSSTNQDEAEEKQ